MKSQMVRVLSIAAVVFTSSFLITKAIACSGGKWPNDPKEKDWNDVKCIQNECGSNKGTKTIIQTCQEHNGSDQCNPGTRVDAQYKYADKIKVGSHWECPTDISVYTSDDSHKDCKKEVVAEHWDNPETRNVTKDCTVEDVVACETTPTVTPTPTPEPQQPQGNGFGLPGDGLSDGRSDGRSSCPECTAPPQGQVLGATTEFAGTGVADEMIMNAVGAMGGISTAAGLVLSAKKKFIK